MPQTLLERSFSELGHMILIDTGGELHGYQSDISRTFTFPIGQFTAEQHDWWELVKAAQNASLAAIKAGARATDIDAAARDVICAGARPGGGANCPEGDAYATFTHRLGHGIGLQVRLGTCKLRRLGLTQLPAEY